jgi:hypothetical protein
LLPFETASGLLETARLKVNAGVTFQCYTLNNGTKLKLFTNNEFANSTAAEETCNKNGARLMIVTNEEELLLFKNFRANLSHSHFVRFGVRTTFNNLLFQWRYRQNGIYIR